MGQRRVAGQCMRRAERTAPTPAIRVGAAGQGIAVGIVSGKLTALGRCGGGEERIRPGVRENVYLVADAAKKGRRDCGRRRRRGCGTIVPAVRRRVIAAPNSFHPTPRCLPVFPRRDPRRQIGRRARGRCHRSECGYVVQAARGWRTAVPSSLHPTPRCPPAFLRYLNRRRGQRERGRRRRRARGHFVRVARSVAS